ncbi:MAG: hypothetical protein ACREN2_07595 [Candidatus Dormibacteria bacterium]
MTAAENEGACPLCPVHLAQSATQLLGQQLGDLIPPEAQKHLANAQRELVLAVMVTIEHNAARTGRTPAPATRKRRSTPSSKSSTSTRAKRTTRRPSRVELD